MGFERCRTCGVRVLHIRSSLGAGIMIKAQSIEILQRMLDGVTAIHVSQASDYSPAFSDKQIINDLKQQIKERDQLLLTVSHDLCRSLEFIAKQGRVDGGHWCFRALDKLKAVFG